MVSVTPVPILAGSDRYSPNLSRIFDRLYSEYTVVNELRSQLFSTTEDFHHAGKSLRFIGVLLIIVFEIRELFFVVLIVRPVKSRFFLKKSKKKTIGKKNRENSRYLTQDKDPPP